MSSQQRCDHAPRYKRYDGPLLNSKERRSSRRYAAGDIFNDEDVSHLSRRSRNSRSARKMAAREDSLGSIGSDRSRASSQRRRRERRYSDKDFVRPWEASHEFYDRSGDEKVEVAETHEYRPRKDSGARDDHRQTNSRQIYGREADAGKGKIYNDTWSRIPDFSANDHAYYCNDWQHQDQLQEEQTLGREKEPRSCHRGYRRDRYEDSELYSQASEFENSEYQRACKYSKYANTIQNVIKP